MTLLEAMDARISRRSYTGPVPAREADGLAGLCKQLSNENKLYIELVPRGAAGLFGGFSKTYGLFKNVQALVVLGVYKASAEELEKLGHAGERVVLEATVRGLGTCWVGGTFDKTAAQSGAPEGVEVAGVLTIGAVGEETGKEKLLRKMMHRKSKTVEQAAQIEGEAPPWFTKGIQAALRAPSAVNGQPVTFVWKDGTASASVPGTRDMQYLDLGIAKLHFELAAGGGRFAVGNGGAYAPAE